MGCTSRRKKTWWRTGKLRISYAGQFVGSDNTIAISALGEDTLADETIEALKEHNLNYLMPRVPYPTGTVQVTLTGDGIPTYEIKENVAWDNIPFTPEMEERNVMSSVVRISVSSLIPHQKTVCVFATSICVSSSTARKCWRIRSAFATS